MQNQAACSTISGPLGPRGRRSWASSTATMMAAAPPCQLLHLTYTLGPGVLVGGQIASGSSDGAADVTQFMLGTAVFF